MRIYLTHCSAEKDYSLRNTSRKVTPDRLYTATSIQAFMSRCKQKQVDWAILSDLYGVWFPDVEHGWYEKPPNTVTEEEFDAIVKDFQRKLESYKEIWFYFNGESFHSFYQRVLQATNLKDRAKLFCELEEIV